MKYSKRLSQKKKKIKRRWVLSGALIIIILLTTLWFYTGIIFVPVDYVIKVIKYIQTFYILLIIDLMSNSKMPIYKYIRIWYNRNIK